MQHDFVDGHQYIDGDGWNKDNDDILALVDVLESAQRMAYEVNSYTVASSYGTPEELVAAVEELADELLAVAEQLRRNV